MKKLLVILVVLIAIISCSKKTTGNKSVAAGTETPPIAVKKVEESSAIKKPTPEGEPQKGEVKKIEAAMPATKEYDAATAEKMAVTLRAAGKETYSVKCTKCHEAFEPIKFNAAKWEKVIDWMGPRAKLEVQEKEAILAYVKYNAKK